MLDMRSVRSNETPWYKTNVAFGCTLIIIMMLLVIAAGAVVIKITAVAREDIEARVLKREERYQKCVNEATRGGTLTPEIMLACTTTVKEIYR